MPLNRRGTNPAFQLKKTIVIMVLCKLLTDDTFKMLYRSNTCPADDNFSDNLKADPLTVPNVVKYQQDKI